MKFNNHSTRSSKRYKKGSIYDKLQDVQAKHDQKTIIRTGGRRRRRRESGRRRRRGKRKVRRGRIIRRRSLGDEEDEGQEQK